ncbi:hypothetical protein ACFL6X_03805 [Candidatus Latescibacterota bacterium]
MDNQRPLFREAAVVDDWAVLSPFTNFQLLSYQLSGTSIRDKWYFADTVRDYRDTYIEYLRTKGAFGSRRWFTDDPADQVPMIANPESVTGEMLQPDSPFMAERQQWIAQQEQLANQDPGRRLNLSDMPKAPTAPSRSLAESLSLMTPGLVVMILLTGVSIILSAARFQRYDPS